MFKKQVYKEVRSPPGDDDKAPSGWLFQGFSTRGIYSGIQLLQGLII
jgi:hypothetical protein